MTESPHAMQNLTPPLLFVLKLGLCISTFGWGISFFFTVEPWNQAVEHLYVMGAAPIEYQPLLGYWLKMASSVFGCIGLTSAVCFLRTERMIETIRLLVPFHLIVGTTLVWAAVSNGLTPSLHKSVVPDIAFCFTTAMLIGLPLFIATRRGAAAIA